MNIWVSPVQARKKTKKVNLIEVSSFIVDEKDSPLYNVTVTSGEGNKIVHTDNSGYFKISVPVDALVEFYLKGYDKKTFKLTGENIIPSKVILKKQPPFMSDNSILNRADGGKIYKAMEVGASSKIMKEDFGSYPDLILTNGLQGKMAGLQIRSITHGLGNNNPQIYVRGLHGMDNNQAIVIVDGVERPLDDLLPEEIESIELHKRCFN